jgi:selenocysteine-specific elongation factor
VIIATAGHVDHGKTTLVKALTGIDTDRLKEEKLRGMSIETGFAYADLGNGFPIGFVDVPGHERFVRNMLAGVAAVDFALLVVAADDGPMPQTVEHLAILGLLGIRQAAVVLTKIDRVSPARIAEVHAQMVVMLAQTLLQGAPVFPVVAGAGIGMAALRSHLTAVARTFQRRAVEGNFRLAVDRCFSLPGAGLVVTGAVFSGVAHIGDQLLAAPQGVVVRVRGIHVHNQSATVAEAGWRCALNLAGSDLKRVDIERGDWIVAAASPAPTDRFDVRITYLASQKKPLAHWASVQLHSGASSVAARIALLEGQTIRPGCTALAQLVTDTPVVVAHGDRFILRDSSAQQTIAGGVVIDPDGPARGRAKPARLAQLAALQQPTPVAALASLLAVQTEGVALERFARAWNLTPAETTVLLQQCPVVVFSHAGQRWAMTPLRWQSMQEQVLLCLHDWHVQQPDGFGPSDAMLATVIGMRVLSPAWRAVIRVLCEAGQVVREGISLRLPAHRPRLSASDAALLTRVSEVLSEADLRPPVIGELAKLLALEQGPLTDFLERASALGHLVRIAKNRFFLPAAMSRLVNIAAELSAQSEHGGFDAAAYRDHAGIGRNVTIEVLEFMDRAHLTHYVAGKRRIIA